MTRTAKMRRRTSKKIEAMGAPYLVPRLFPGKEKMVSAKTYRQMLERQNREYVPTISARADWRWLHEHMQLEGAE